MRSSDLGPDFAKYGIVEVARHDGEVDAAFAGDGAAGVERHPALARHPLVDQRIARPGIEGDRIAGFGHIGNVRNAADIDEDDGIAASEGLRQRARKRRVIGRNERRPLPAKGHVVRPHVEHDRKAGFLCQQRTVAELHRKPRAGRCRTVWP